MNIVKKIACAASLIIPFLVLSGCASNETLPSEELKLTKEYSETSNFIDDGIGFATLTVVSDGDTATFRLNSKAASGEETVRIRFYNIDTPESTGTVEKWGKAASNFTTDKLNSATSIVLEATSTPASHDSYGERYLGYVWYKSEGMNDYKMVNMEVVENGFSRTTASPADPYYSQFKAAESYATSKKLHLWSNDDDPLFNDKAYIVTLEELLNDLASSESLYYNAEQGVGSKVRFEAYVLEHTTSGSASSPTHNYTVAAKKTNGEEVTIQLYGGYSSDQINGYIKVGSLYSFVGTVQKRNEGFQVAIGQTYVPLQTGDNLMSRVQKDYYCIFNSNHARYTMSQETGIRSNVTITNVSKTDTLLTITATGHASSTAEEAGTLSTYTFNISITSSTDVSKIVVGKTFTTKAFQTAADSNIFTIDSISDIVLK